MTDERTDAIPFEECMPRLRAYARSLTRESDAADDLVQDTLLRAWSAREQFTAGTNFNAWMLTILRHRFLDQRRSHRSGMPLNEASDVELTARPPQDMAIQFDEMARAFWRLAPHYREILILVGAKGLDYAEAAKTIGCAVGTVRSRLSRARSALHLALEKERSSLGSPARRRKSAAPGASELLRALEAA
jgi:RNA polymerase sigma-70 factor (ECF subfamily)